MGGHDFLKTVLPANPFHPFFQLFNDNGAFRGEKGQPRPDFFGKNKEIQTLAQLSVITFLRFGPLGEKGFQLVFGFKGRTVYPLQHGPLFIPPPISAGHMGQFKKTATVSGALNEDRGTYPQNFPADTGKPWDRPILPASRL